MNLRIVNGLFMKLVVDKIGDSASEKAKQTPELINLIVHTAKCYMKDKHFKPKKKSIEDAWAKISFAGNDERKISQFKTECLELVHPESV